MQDEHRSEIRQGVKETLPTTPTLPNSSTKKNNNASMLERSKVLSGRPQMKCANCRRSGRTEGRFWEKDVNGSRPDPSLHYRVRRGGINGYLSVLIGSTNGVNGEQNTTLIDLDFVCLMKKI